MSIGRINKFLRSEELDEDSVSHDQLTGERQSKVRSSRKPQYHLLPYILDP